MKVFCLDETLNKWIKSKQNDFTLIEMLLYHWYNVMVTLKANINING